MGNLQGRPAGRPAMYKLFFWKINKLSESDPLPPPTSLQDERFRAYPCNEKIIEIAENLTALPRPPSLRGAECFFLHHQPI